MTNNHCPKPEDIRTVITVGMRNEIEKLAQDIVEKFEDALEDMSFDAFQETPPEGWEECKNCEVHVLNAQEKALDNLILLFVSAVRKNTPIFDKD